MSNFSHIVYMECRKCDAFKELPLKCPLDAGYTTSWKKVSTDEMIKDEEMNS